MSSDYYGSVAGDIADSGVTPGQTAYEAHRASWWKRHGMDSGGLLPDGQWDAMAGADGAQDDWEAAAQAVIAQRQASCEAALADIIAAREMHADREFADGDFVFAVFDALDVLAAQGEDAQRHADLQAHAGGMGGPLAAYVSDAAAGLGDDL